MRVLVTGAAGFIGSTVVAYLLERGAEIVALDRRPVSFQGVKTVQADLCARYPGLDLAGQIGPCDALVHTAAVIDMSPFNPDIVLANCLGTQQALNLAGQLNVGIFVFLSSVPVIGMPERLPIKEDHPACPLTAYHASKLFGEHMVAIAAHDALVGTTLRLTSPVGPGMPHNRILSAFVKQAMTDRPIRLLGRGTRRQNYVDVRDIAIVIEQALHRKIAGVFQIAGRTCISNLELAHKCIRLLESSSDVQFTGTPDPEEGVTWDVSISKAESMLGYDPVHDIDSSIIALRHEYADSFHQ